MVATANNQRKYLLERETAHASEYPLGCLRNTLSCIVTMST